MRTDPTTQPKQIDFTPDMGEYKGEAYRGIYEAGEGLLTIRLPRYPRQERSVEIQERPTGMPPNFDSCYLVFVFKRR